MLALHALWSRRGRLCIWAEDGAVHISTPSRRRGRPRANPAPVDHLFAARAETVLAALIQTGVDVSTTATSTEEQLTLWLPCAGGIPTASPELVWTDEQSGPSAAANRLVRFTMAGISFAPGPALDTLLDLAAAHEAPVGIGASVLALATLAGLALELTAGGRFLPGLERRDDTTVVARWHPVRSDRDAERELFVARSLPPFCRAEAVAGVSGPDRTDQASRRPTDTGQGRSAHEVVHQALDAMVDAACREAFTANQVSSGRAPGGGPFSVIETWIRALGDADPIVGAPPGELATLEHQLTEWTEPATRSSGAWRLCFRLVEPPPPDEGDDVAFAARPGAGAGVAPVESTDRSVWRLELLLQAENDPSLLISSRDVWRAGPSLQHVTGIIDTPQEVLLAELGRAVRYFPGLTGALEGRAPEGLDLDTEGAYRFLKDSAPGLELASFGVLLPAWWRRPSATLGMRLRASPRQQVKGATSGLLGVEGICDYDWQAALGDARVDVDELRSLARLKAPLVRVRGQWVELQQSEVDRMLGFLEREGKRSNRAMTVGQVMQIASGLQGPVADVPVMGVETEGWLSSLLGGETEAVAEVGTPAGFNGELRAYQSRGLGWLQMLGRLGLGACLADDMGLGKTATVLALELADRLTPSGRRPKTGVAPTLVICPTSVVGNWHKETERFAPGLRVQVHHGTRRSKADDFAEQAGGVDLIITSYALASRDKAAMSQVAWHRVVLDEAQNVKNPGAQQTKAVRTLVAAQKVALTGTPVENHLGELWSIMELVNPGLLGSASSFRERFALPIERFRDEEAAERLRRVTRPFILRRLKTDRSVITDLPDKIEMKVLCNLTREQVTLYQAVVNDMLEKIDELEGIKRRGLVLTTMLRLKQVCNHPAQFLGDGSELAGRSGKMERTVEVIEEVLSGAERALVFTQFAEMGALLRDHLQHRLNCRASFLHGGVSRTRRDAMVADFQSGGSTPVMVLSLKAGGTGLNLTAANHVLHFDRWWNPAVENQATDRAFRIGQSKNVQVRKLVCGGTLEDRIDAMIEKKQDLADRIVGAGEGWLTELSTTELAEVFRLSADAVNGG
jgi:non-specific serine/threonine protein kinase